MHLCHLALLLFIASPYALAETPVTPKVSKNIAYVAGGHERQKLDLFLPPDTKQDCPLLVWVHGGAWKEGNKENCPAVGMVAKGWAVASLNYRLSQHAIFPAQLEDCKAAIRFLRAHAAEYRIDKSRVATWGASAGGHLVALLGTTAENKTFDVGENLDQSSAVCCCIDWFGPTDFLNLESSPIKGDQKDDVIAKLLGGLVSEKKELAKLGSPIYHVSKTSAPMLIMHGDKDPLVPLQQSESFLAALQKAGVPATLKVYPGHGHGGPKFTDEAARTMMIEFVEKNTPAKPVPEAK